MCKVPHPTQELLVERESVPLMPSLRGPRVWKPHWRISDRQSGRPLLLIRKRIGRPYQIFDTEDHQPIYLLKSRFKLFKYHYVLYGSHRNPVGRIEAPIWRWGYRIRLINSTGQIYRYLCKDPEGKVRDDSGRIVMKLNNYPPGVESDLTKRADLQWMEWYLLELLDPAQPVLRADEFSAIQLLAITSLPLRWKWQSKK